MFEYETLFGLLQNLAMVMAMTTSLVTWFIYPDCSALSSWLLIQGVSLTASLFLLLCILFLTMSHVQRYGSLDGMVLTNLATAFLFLLVIIGFTIGWTILGCFLYISAWSGNILACRIDEGRQVRIFFCKINIISSFYFKALSIIGSCIVLLNVVGIGRIFIVIDR